MIRLATASNPYVVTRRDLRRLKRALRIAKRTQTFSTECQTLQTYVIGELNNLNSDPSYRVNTEILVGHLNACILTSTNYNRAKQSLLSKVTATTAVITRKG